MNTRLLASFAFAVALGASAQTNITQLGHLDYQALHNSHLSNLWGYTDEFGNEYALVGVNGVDQAAPPNPGGVSVVDVTDPANPVEVAFIPTLPSIWREIKVWNDHAYVTTEAAAGLLIIDLSPLPGSTTLPTTTFTGNGWNTAHSLFIDENGRMYLNGTGRGNGGVIMYDLTQDPMAPVEVGEYDAFYVHDCFARGDTLYAAHIYDGFFSVVDVSDPATPVLLGTQPTPNAFPHNMWLDPSGDHLYTTDEKSNAYVAAFDVSDLTDINLLDKLQSDPGSLTIPHNTYCLGNNFLVTSYYTYGVTIYDAEHPDNLVETGNFDSSPLSGNGFNGAWGVYPFLPSGNLIVSDIEEGLFILAPTYAHASWLKGVVTDAQTSSPINNAEVTILGTNVVDHTALDGRYATGYHTAGTYDVRYFAPGYMADTLTVNLVTNTIVQQDVALVPLVPLQFSGVVLDAQTGDPVPFAVVELTNQYYTYGFTCDASGLFSQPIYAETYAVNVGQWGWQEVCFTAQYADSIPVDTILLESGYHDDFALDLGWSVSATASAGIWRRVVPVGQSDSGIQLQTDVDLSGDCGDKCYVTGNGPDIGTDDVQDGSVTLLSPVFDATLYTDPVLHWSYWYLDGSLNGPVDDSLWVLLRTGGVDHLLTAIHPNANMSLWTADSVRVSDIVPPAADMQLVIVAAKYVDIGNHLLECAVDGFDITEHVIDAIAENNGTHTLVLWPNPNDGSFSLVNDDRGTSIVTVTDAQGRVIRSFPATGATVRVEGNWASGIYAVRVQHAGGSVVQGRMVVR